MVSSTDTGWILTNALVTYAIGFDANGDLVLQDLRRTGDTLSWRPSPVRDTVFRVEDREVGLTRNNAAGFRHVGAEVSDTGIGLELRLTFEDLRDGLRARRVYAIHPQVALVEAWTELESHQWPVHDRERSRSRSSWSSTARWPRRSTVSRGRRRAAGRSRSITTSCPRTRPSSSRSADARRSATCRSCRWLRRAARSCPGLMWSGAWRMDLVGKPGGRTELTAWLSSTTTSVTPTRTVTMPHAFVGVVAGDESQIAPALHRYIVSVLRGGRLLEPLVTYNTWFSSGAEIDEESIDASMFAAAAAGAELFELDAGWYEGAGELRRLRLRLGPRHVARRQEEVPARPARAGRSCPRPRHEVRRSGSSRSGSICATSASRGWPARRG